MFARIPEPPDRTDREPDDGSFRGVCDYCGETTRVSVGPDPYAWEIRHDETEHTLCDKCYERSSDEI